MVTASTHEGWWARYAELADALTEVRRLVPERPVLGISTLHPRHALPPDHPALVEAWARNGSATPARPLPLPGWIAQAIRLLAFAARETAVLAWLRLTHLTACERLMAEPADILLKTWGFGPTVSTRPADFYYGSLPEQLAQRGVRCVVLCGDATGGSPTAFAADVLRQTRWRAMPETLLVPLWAPLLTAWQQLRASRRLAAAIRSAAEPRLTRMFAAAQRASLATITLRNTLFYYIARTAVRAWRARVFVTLYEGQPWEQPAWAGAKAADPACRTVGYQHTILLPHSLSVLAPRPQPWGPSRPDVALCVGQVTRAMMAGTPAWHGESEDRLVVFGTYRRAGVERAAAPRPPTPPSILVLPEGYLNESKTLFTFAMEAAARLPTVRFILRCHPVLPFDRVRSVLAHQPEAFPNVEVSTEPAIEADYARASVLLYRGSSAVLYAILAGLKPVYLDDGRAPAIDPLFALPQWRAVVRTPEDLSQALARLQSQEAPARETEWRAAADYAASYTQPVDAAALDRFLASVNLAENRGRS
jgi:hypothetical protein